MRLATAWVILCWCAAVIGAVVAAVAPTWWARSLGALIAFEYGYGLRVWIVDRRTSLKSKLSAHPPKGERV